MANFKTNQPLDIRKVQLYDALGNPLTSTLVGSDQALDVNVVQSVSGGYSPGTIDTFGHFVTGLLSNQVDIQFFRDSPGNLVTVTTAGGGSAASNLGGALFSSSTGATGEAKGVTDTTTMYRSGAEVYCLIAAAWLDGGAATSFQRLGLYDDNNGFFIGFENTSFGVTVRNNAVDSTTALASFSDDPLDGSSTSSFTRDGTPEALDTSKLNVFRIRFGWLGSAPVKFEVLNPDGDWVTFHTVKFPNLQDEPSIRDADLPVTLHIKKTAGATNLRMQTDCWGAGVTTNLIPINATINGDWLAPLGRSVITGETTAGGGSFVNVKVNPSGTLETNANQATHDNLNANANLQVGNTDVANGNPVPVSDAGGSLTVDATALPLPTGAATAANQTTANTSLGIMDDWDNAASDGASVSGDVAHDSADAGEPVKIGYKAIAHGASPTAVAASDRTDAYANRHGIPFTIGGHPNVETWTDENTAAGSNEVLKTVNAGQKAIITMISVYCDNANTVDVDVLLEFDDTADVYVAHHPGIAPGSGFVEGTGAGILAIGGDGQDVIWTNEVPTGGSVRITVRGYIVPS